MYNKKKLMPMKRKMILNANFICCIPKYLNWNTLTKLT